MTNLADPLTLARWLRVTWLGWLLGIPCVVVLALLGEGLGIGGTQSIVGAGMGVGVGVLQALALRRVGLRPAGWIASSAVGLALPFLPFDLAHLFGRSLPYSLAGCVAAGGVIVGTWQALLLRARFAGAAWWIPASILGWLLAAGMAGFSDRLLQAHAVRGLAGAGLYLGLIALGGVAVGLVTGWALRYRLRALTPAHA